MQGEYDVAVTCYMNGNKRIGGILNYEEKEQDDGWSTAYHDTWTYDVKYVYCRSVWLSYEKQFS